MGRILGVVNVIAGVRAGGQQKNPFGKGVSVSSLAVILEEPAAEAQAKEIAFLGWQRGC